MADTVNRSSFETTAPQSHEQPPYYAVNIPHESSSQSQQPHETISSNGKSNYPFPNKQHKYLSWQDWTIPIPFIPMKRPIPLIFSACCLVLGAYWDGVLAMYGQNQQRLNQPKLPDVWHDWLPYIGQFTPRAHNIYVGIWGALTVIRFVPTRSFFWEIARRFLFIWGILFFFRGVCDGLTIETKANYYCVPTYLSPNIWLNGAKYIFGAAHTCSDLMYSGHTMAFTLLTLQWTNYDTGAEFQCFKRLKPIWLRNLFLPSFTATGDVNSTTIITWFAWFTAIGGYIILLAVRAHYSCDILVSALFTYALYKSYLYYIKTVYDYDSYFADFVIWFEGLTPPPDGQATLSVMSCASYSRKTAAYLPPQWTFFDAKEPEYITATQYDVEAAQFTQPQPASPHVSTARQSQQIESIADQHYTSQPFAGAQPITITDNNNYTAAGQQQQLTQQPYTTSEQIPYATAQGEYVHPYGTASTNNHNIHMA